MREFPSIGVPPWGVDGGFYLELSLGGYFSKEYQQKSVPTSYESSENPS